MFPRLFDFLRDLKANNRKDWFQENRARYDRDLLEPALEFIGAFAPHLKAISLYYMAEARASGGALFRIYRDVRFSSDKSPYKTQVGMHFRHEEGKDAHCPGFYLHLEPGQVFAGAGLWRPDAPTLARLRAGIAAAPARWQRVIQEVPLEPWGDVSSRPPRGYAKDHPLIEEIKRKDFALIYLHHLIAFGLLYAGYMLNLNRFGMFTILLLDSASIWVELCRLAMYLSLERMKNVCFIILAVVWFVTRLVIFPLR